MYNYYAPVFDRGIFLAYSHMKYYMTENVSHGTKSGDRCFTWNNVIQNVIVLVI